jgi:hypothetical protein
MRSVVFDMRRLKVYHAALVAQTKNIIKQKL